jgi:hypothetical protein
MDYASFSFLVPLPDDAAVNYALDLAQRIRQVCEASDKEATTTVPLPAPLYDFVPDIGFKIERATKQWIENTHLGSAHNQGIWISVEEGCSSEIHAACVFVQHLLQKFLPHDFVAFEWAEKELEPFDMRGGASLVTATEIKEFLTSEWLDRELAELAATPADNKKGPKIIIQGLTELPGEASTIHQISSTKAPNAFRALTGAFGPQKGGLR